ncbi:uncharacterized protein ACOB8E_009173 [Sarcophilus harrisii]
MAWPLVCLLLLTCCSGSFSQPVLTQAPSMSESLGATARLTCTLSSQHKGYTIGWYQQSPGKAPGYLMRVYSDGDVYKGEGVPDRFSGSASGANSYLSISNIQAEDEADYYCGAGYVSGGNYGLHSATFSEEVGQKPPCQPSPPPPQLLRLLAQPQLLKGPRVMEDTQTQTHTQKVLSFHCPVHTRPLVGLEGIAKNLLAMGPSGFAYKAWVAWALQPRGGAVELTMAPPPPSPIPGSQGEDKRGLAEPGPSRFSLGSRALGVPCTMAWPLVCLLLLTCCSGSFSQPVLTQAPSMSASLGATARLTCTLSSQHNAICWHQQSPGKAPRYLMYVSSSGSAGKAEGVPDRFSGSASGADRYLSISNIQAEDEADYYCGAGDSDGLHCATFSEEVGQKSSCEPSPRPTAAPTSGPAPAAKGPEVLLPVSLSQAQSPMSRTWPRAH